MDIQPEALRERLNLLRQQHRDLDITIADLETSPAADQLQLRRLKKHKLLLKDEITQLEDQKFPDIIA